MRNRMLILLVFSLMLALGGAAAAASLEEGFAHPPRAARPLVWWHWVSGNISKEGIRADLEAMKRSGIGGVQMFDVDLYLPHGPVEYGSDAWHEHVQYAMRVADELGLEFMSMNCAGWSQSAGPWITPERGMKTLVWSETKVAGGSARTIALAQPKAKLDFYRDVAVIAVPADAARVEDLTAETGLKKPNPKKLEADWEEAEAQAITPGAVIDLTAHLSSDGKLNWAAPAGKWTVLRFGYTATGAKNHPAMPTGLGLEVDKFDAEAVAFHFQHGLGRILREAGALAGKTYSGILFDSWEAGMQNWTAKFPELFRTRRGYDLRPLLPCLAGRVVGSRGQTEAFLADFRKTLGELYASEHYGTIARLAHERGLKVYAEAYGGCLDEAAAAETVDVPMAEFWMHMQSLSCQRSTSLAHTTGKPVVAAESFTARPPDGRWRETPALLKPIGDAAFIEGINRFCLHTWALQPRSDLAPGFSSGRYGTHFGRLNTWWDFAPAWIEYISRCQFLLQSGRSAKDLLYLRHEGLDPSDLKDYPQAPFGYGVDYLATRQLLEARVERGVIKLPGGDYRALVLPEHWAASLAALKKIRELVVGGAAVFGAEPVCPAGLMDLREHAAEWKALVSNLWGGESANRVVRVEPPSAQAVIWRQDLDSLLRNKVIEPDFTCGGGPGSPDVRFAHRVADGADIYFISNQKAATITITARFRVHDRQPELWDAVTGRIMPAVSYRLEHGRIVLPLELEPAGSIFVVFRKPLPDKWITSIAQTNTVPLPNAPARIGPGGALTDEAGDYEIQDAAGGEKKVRVEALPAPIEVAGPWRVAFQPGRGAPESITLERLESLSKNADPGVRYFSGVTTYTTSFTMPAESPKAGLECVLELGEVNDIAAVRMNGAPCGIQWTGRRAVRVTQQMRPGRNDLAIAVANTWVNRLIGDESLSPDADYELKGSIFTVGRLLRFPSWWSDPAAIKSRQRVTFPVWRHYTKDDSLLPSGLVGPVRLRYAQVVR